MTHKSIDDYLPFERWIASFYQLIQKKRWSQDALFERPLTRFQVVDKIFLSERRPTDQPRVQRFDAQRFQECKYKGEAIVVAGCVRVGVESSADFRRFEHKLERVVPPKIETFHLARLEQTAATHFGKQSHRPGLLPVALGLSPRTQTKGRKLGHRSLAVTNANVKIVAVN